jgi:four helix bundle protein
MRENVIRDKSFDFAVRIVNLYKYLIGNEKEFVLSKQLLRSGTSVGANVEEGLSGQSKKDFVAKLSISLKEAKETHYWLRLLYKCEYIDKKMFDSIIVDCDEVIVILTRILKTSRNNLEIEKCKM